MSSATPWWANPQTAPAQVRRPIAGRLAAATAALVAVGIMLLSAAQTNLPRAQVLASGAVQEPASITAIAANCRGIITWPAPPADEIGWVADGPNMWRSTPPASGNFARTPVDDGFYAPGSDGAPDFMTALSAAYRGTTVIWYSPRIEPETREVLRRYAAGQDRLVVAEWPQGEGPNGSNPPDAITLVSWGRAQTCKTYSTAVLDQFRAGVGEGNAPGWRLADGDPGPQALKRTLEQMSQGTGPSPALPGLPKPSELPAGRT